MRIGKGGTARISGVWLLALLAASFSEAWPRPVLGQVFQSDAHDFRVVKLGEGLQNPWGLAFLPDGDLLVTERPGRLRIVRKGLLLPAPVQGVPDVVARGQGGLLDVALHPDFASNRWVYLSFSKAGRGGATTAVVRGRYDDGRLTDLEEIIEADARSGRSVHFGSRLLFDRDGYLFVSVGERGEMREAQNRGNHQGTVLRLHDDGRVPADNPFVGQPSMRPEIFSYGHRNPQGLALHPETGEIWNTEHGPRGGDELNRVKAGANYGWPVITYGIDYDGSSISDLSEKAGMEQPATYWVPSIATSGLTIYAGDAFPGWRGSFFVGGLAGTQLARVVLRDGKTVEREVLLSELRLRIRDVRVGPDGFLYVLPDEGTTSVLRLEPVR